jgi:hypothetical protein
MGCDTMVLQVKRSIYLGAIFVLVLMLAVTTVFAVLYYTSQSVSKTLEVEGLDAILLATNTFSNYDNRVLATEFYDNSTLTTVRHNTVILALDDWGINDHDLSMKITTFDAPEGAIVTCKMAWYFYGLKTGTALVRLFRDDSSYVDWVADGVTEPSIDFTDFRSVPVNLDVGAEETIILNANVDRLLYAGVRPEIADPTIDDCCGIMLKFTFDVSGVTDPWGAYPTTTTISLGNA